VKLLHLRGDEELAHKLRTGKITLNEARRVCGLQPLECETANSRCVVLKGSWNNSQQLVCQCWLLLSL